MVRYSYREPEQQKSSTKVEPADRSMPIKARLNFNDTLARMKYFHNKKEQKLTELKRSENRKIMKELTTSPRINENGGIEVNGTFYDRMREDTQKRENRLDMSSERIKFLKPELKELTFSPRINKSSHDLSRSINDMYVWEKKRNFKVSIMQAEKEEEDFDFKPTIKSGVKTRHKYLDSDCHSARKSTKTLVDEETNQESKEKLKQIRKDMTPKINDKSKKLVANRAKYSYLNEGTLACPLPIKNKESYQIDSKKNENKSTSIILDKNTKRNSLVNEKTSCTTKSVKSVIDKSTNNYNEMPNNDSLIAENFLKITENVKTEFDLSFNGSLTVYSNEVEDPKPNEKKDLLVQSEQNIGIKEKSIIKKEALKSSNKNVIHTKNMNFITPKKIAKSTQKIPWVIPSNATPKEDKENIGKNSNEKSCNKSNQKSARKSQYAKFSKKGYDINADFDYNRAINVLKPVEKANTSKEKVFKRCHGYATYDHSSGDFNESLRDTYFNEVGLLQSLEGSILDRSNSKSCNKNRLKNLINTKLTHVKKKEDHELEICNMKNHTMPLCSNNDSIEETLYYHDNQNKNFNKKQKITKDILNYSSTKKAESRNQKTSNNNEIYISLDKSYDTENKIKLESKYESVNISKIIKEKKLTSYKNSNDIERELLAVKEKSNNKKTYFEMSKINSARMSETTRPSVKAQDNSIKNVNQKKSIKDGDFPKKEIKQTKDKYINQNSEKDGYIDDIHTAVEENLQRVKQKASEKVDIFAEYKDLLSNINEFF